MAKKIKLNDGNKISKPFYKKWWVWLIAIVILGAVFGEESQEVESNVDEVSSESESSSEVIVESSSEIVEESSEVTQVEYDTKFEQYANEVFGEDLRSYDYLKDEGKIVITTFVPGNLTEKMMKRAFHMRVVDYAKGIKDEDFIDFYVDGEASMTDQYGNTEDSKVLTIGMNKDTVEKINFDSFNIDNLEDVADAVFVHPAFAD